MELCHDYDNIRQGLGDVSADNDAAWGHPNPIGSRRCSKVLEGGGSRSGDGCAGVLAMGFVAEPQSEDTPAVQEVAAEEGGEPRKLEVHRRGCAVASGMASKGLDGKPKNHPRPGRRSR